MMGPVHTHRVSPLPVAGKLPESRIPKSIMRAPAHTVRHTPAGIGVDAPMFGLIVRALK